MRRNTLRVKKYCYTSDAVPGNKRVDCLQFASRLLAPPARIRTKKKNEHGLQAGTWINTSECGPKILERRRPLIKDLTPATYNGEPDPRIKPSGPHLAK
ncbi:uncharacterized protein LOC141532847 isoform X2 [Cotesia typhae]|uniref:uncharacterized protein LOC141532847 isoform X2 n=1 Tax=Cotesia typhae TaxID=2053667 RepID=UPI003D693838